MKDHKDTEQGQRREQLGNNPSDAGTNRQQQQTQQAGGGGGTSQQHQQGNKGPQNPAASGSHQTLQPHASGHDQAGKGAGRANSNDDSGNAPHRGG